MLGPGLCAPLEGGIDAADAMTALGACWATNYQPFGPTPHLRSWHYSPQQPDGSVSGDWWARVLAHQADPSQVTIIGNEPNGQDALPAVEAARRIRDDFVERIVVYDPNRPQGQLPVVLPVLWCGPNCMFGVGSTRQWVRDYQAAGGPPPHWWGVHMYPTTGSELWAWVEDELAWLDSIGWSRPLVLTEIGPRPGSGDAADVLRTAFDVWRAGRIAGFAWFSTIYNEDGGMWAAGNLLRPDATLTALGAQYRELATGQPPPVVEAKPWLWFPTISQKD